MKGKPLLKLLPTGPIPRIPRDHLVTRVTRCNTFIEALLKAKKEKNNTAAYIARHFIHAQVKPGAYRLAGSDPEELFLVYGIRETQRTGSVERIFSVPLLPINRKCEVVGELRSVWLTDTEGFFSSYCRDGHPHCARYEFFGYVVHI